MPTEIIQEIINVQVNGTCDDPRSPCASHSYFLNNPVGQTKYQNLGKYKESILSCYLQVLQFEPVIFKKTVDYSVNKCLFSVH